MDVNAFSCEISVSEVFFFCLSVVLISECNVNVMFF